MVVPTFTLYAEGQFGASPLQASILYASYYIAQFFASPAIGRYSDKVGRRPVLIWSQVGTVFSFAILFLIPAIGRTFPIFATLPLLLLFFSRTLDGLTGGNITAAQAYIGDITSGADQTKALAMIHTAFAVGLILGPAFGGILANWGLTVPFIGATAISLLSLTITYFYLAESPQHTHNLLNQHKKGDTPWHTFLRVPQITIILAVGFVVTFVVSGLSAVFPLFAERVLFSQIEDLHIISRNVGYMLSYLGLMAVISQGVILPQLIGRFSEPALMRLALVAAILTGIGLLLTNTVSFTLLILTPAALAYTIGLPASEAMLFRYGEDHQKGQLIGLYASSNSLANIIGPITSGYLLQQHLRAPFVCALFLALIALALTYPLRRR